MLINNSLTTAFAAGGVTACDLLISIDRVIVSGY